MAPSPLTIPSNFGLSTAANTGRNQASLPHFYFSDLQRLQQHQQIIETMTTSDLIIDFLLNVLHKSHLLVTFTHHAYS